MRRHPRDMRASNVTVEVLGPNDEQPEHSLFLTDPETVQTDGDEISVVGVMIVGSATSIQAIGDAILRKARGADRLEGPTTFELVWRSVGVMALATGYLQGLGTPAAEGVAQELRDTIKLLQAWVYPGEGEEPE